MKLFVDRDAAKAPPGWTHVGSATEAINILDTDEVRVLSLDYELADDSRDGTGYDVLLWIEEQVNLAGYEPPSIAIHTDNPAAKKRMQSAVDKIVRTYELSGYGYDDDDDDGFGGPAQWQ